MPLILRRRTEMPDRDAFAVYSGEALVGVISRVPNGAGQGWHWSITGFHVHPHERGPGSGLAPSREEEAQAQFGGRWRSWLAWAGVQDTHACGAMGLIARLS